MFPQTKGPLVNLSENSISPGENLPGDKPDTKEKNSEKIKDVNEDGSGYESEPTEKYSEEENNANEDEEDPRADVRKRLKDTLTASPGSRLGILPISVISQYTSTVGTRSRHSSSQDLSKRGSGREPEGDHGTYQRVSNRSSKSAQTLPKIGSEEVLIIFGTDHLADAYVQKRTLILSHMSARALAITINKQAPETATWSHGHSTLRLEAIPNVPRFAPIMIAALTRPGVASPYLQVLMREHSMSRQDRIDFEKILEHWGLRDLAAELRGARAWTVCGTLGFCCKLGVCIILCLIMTLVVLTLWRTLRPATTPRSFSRPQM